MSDNEEPLFNFTAPQFERLMETQGLENTTRALVLDGDEMMGGGQMTYEGLRDGTAPILNVLPGYSGVEPENRKLNDEAILSLFTNVEDYGMYDPESTGEGAYGQAVKTSIARAAPESIAQGFGFAGGMKAAAPLAAYIPPAGLPGLALKGIVLLGGGIAGAIAAGFAAEEAEKAIIGEKAPVVPSLEGADRMGETIMFGVSMLHAPYTMAPKAADKVVAGSVQFLDNFKGIATGKLATTADDAIELTAKNGGLGERFLAQAQLRANKAAEVGGKAAAEAAKKGPMFSKFSQSGKGVDLGLFRFNPRGNLTDPLKGPVSSRIAAGIEGGARSGMQAVRERPLRFMTIETGAALGAGVLANVAQQIDPYDDSTRFWMEMGGAALVPIPMQMLVEKGPEAAGNLFRTMRNWAVSDTREGLLKGKVEKEAGTRILAALKESTEYKPGVAGDEQIEKFISSLMDQAVDVDGNPAPGTVKDLAVAFDMPMNKTIVKIQEQLETASEELSVATARGRDQMLTAAKSTIADLMQTGDPSAMALAARMQQSIFEQNITDQIETKVTKLYDAAENVLKNAPDGGSQQVKLSQKLYGLLDNQVKASKKVEGELWDAVGNYPITTFVAKNGKEMTRPNLLLLLDKPAQNGGLKFSSKTATANLNSVLGQGLKDDIADFKDYFVNGQGKNPVTSQTLYEMRSGAQDVAANLRANGKIQLAKHVDKISDAILRDLTGQKNSDSAPYNAARAYTYARNNVFTRSFIGDMQSFDKDRSLTMDPDQLVKKLFQGGNLATVQRIEEINRAGRFGLEHFLPEAALNQTSTQEVLDLVVRDSLRKVMDKKEIIDPITRQATGEFRYEINPKRLESFKKEPGTQELFAIFPNLKRDLETTQTAKRLYDSTQVDLVNLGKSRATTAFQNVLNFEDTPSNAVAKALSSNSPAKAMRELLDLTQTAKSYVDPDTSQVFTADEAKMGLRKAIMDYATFSSGGAGLQFSPTVFEDRLFAQVPKVSTKFTLMDFMKEHDMFTQPEVDKIQRAIKQMRGVEEAFQTGNLESVLFKRPSLQKTFYTRVIGATLGQKGQETFNKLLGKIGLGTSGGGIGGGMVAAETGSQAFQQAILRGPESQIVKTMSNLFSEPALLAPLLKEIKSKQDADSAMKALETGFAGLARQAGRRVPYVLRATSEEITDDQTPVPETPVEVQKPPVQLRPVLPPNNQQGALNPPVLTPTQNSGPALGPVNPPPAAVQTASQGSGPVDRTKFAALFPEDRELLGIGSLMGQA